MIRATSWLGPPGIYQRWCKRRDLEMRWDGGGGEMKWSEKKWNKGFIIFAGIRFSRLKETSVDVTNDEGIPRELNDGLIFSPPPVEPTSNSLVSTPHRYENERGRREKRRRSVARLAILTRNDTDGGGYCAEKVDCLKINSLENN